MSGTFASDISYYQRPVDDSYPWRWLIFRACDGTFQDSNFGRNLAWAKHAAASGKLTGYTVYAVYRPGVDVPGMVKAMIGAPDGFVTVMLDIESWGRAILGDHSDDITRQLNTLAAWLGDQRRVIAYGNQGDLASIYPRRPSWVKLIVASYGSIKPSVANMIGWQYSDGQATYPVPAGWPRGVAPFGPSDVNHFDLDPAALAAALGVGDDVSAADVWSFDIRNPKTGAVQSAAQRLIDAETNAAQAADDTDALRKQVASLQATVTSLQATVAKLQTGGAVAPTHFTGSIDIQASAS